MRVVLVMLLVATFPAYAPAGNVEPGSIWVGAAMGPDFRLGSTLGGSGAHWLLGAQGEYAINKSLGVIADLRLGLADTVPLLLRAGARYRLADLDLPVLPFGQAELSGGRLFDVLGADLTTVGLALGLGAEYFLTTNLSVGGLLGVDLSTTLGERPASYTVIEVLAVVRYAVFQFSAGAPQIEQTAVPATSP